MSPNTKIITIIETNFSIAITNDSATVLSVSEGVTKLLGFEADDFLSKKVSLHKLIHPDDHDIVDGLFSNKIEVIHIHDIQIAEATSKANKKLKLKTQ